MRATTRSDFLSAYLMGLLQLRYEHDTTSYEELCAFEQ